MIQISFVIAVYNGKSSIIESINSIRKWNFEEDIEIIIIDDGSTDGTSFICDQIKEKDDRISVFHIENCGQGLARNLGIEKSRGKYICFADADDIVSVEQVNLLLKTAEELNLDIAYGSYKRVNQEQEEWIHLPVEGFVSRYGSREEYQFYNRIKTESSFGYLWNKIYRKGFLIQHNLWLEDIRKVYMEDLLFQLKIWTKNPVVYCVDYPIYNYYITNNSTTRKIDDQIDKKNLAMIRNYIEYLKKEDILNENMEMLVPVLCRVVCWSLVKNIPYEGISYRKIKNRLNTFLIDPYIKDVLNQKKGLEYLWLLPSKIQSVFYSLIFFAMKKGWGNFIALLFYCMYPFMKCYIKISLK